MLRQRGIQRNKEFGLFKKPSISRATKVINFYAHNTLNPEAGNLPAGA
jgi:hypothetical protein